MSIITYWGGKSKLAKRIVALIPEHKLYVEPYFGGGSVFFEKERSHSELINDINAVVSIFYRVLKDDYQALKKKVDTTLYDRNLHSYVLNVYRQPHWYRDVDIAHAFFSLSTIGFSGTLTSFGCHTKGNRAKTLENKKKALTPDLSKRFEGVQIENTDALKLISLRDSSATFYYLDPPYVGTAHAMYPIKFTEEIFRELLDSLSILKGTFILSSFPSEMLTEYIKANNWHSIEIDQTKPASRNPDGTKKRKTEVLTMNFIPNDQSTEH